MENSSGKNIQSLSRAIKIMQCFYESDELGLTEISRRVELHKNTTYGLISTLEEHGLIEKNRDTGKYRLGNELFCLGMKVKSDLRNVALPYIEKLAELSKETVNLVIYDNGAVLYLEKLESPHSMRICTKVGERLPMYCTAVGKAILASMSENEASDVLGKIEMTKFTKNTITDRRLLEKELERIRSARYAEDNEELEGELCCIAAPIFNHNGKAFAALSVSGPVSRMKNETKERLATKLIEYVREISGKLGYFNNK